MATTAIGVIRPMTETSALGPHSRWLWPGPFNVLVANLAVDSTSRGPRGPGSGEPQKKRGNPKEGTGAAGSEGSDTPGIEERM